MAGSLKVKIGIAAFAVIILLGIPLLENSFFAPVTIKRWATLSWDDFQGIPQPFSSYEAAIASAVYLQYDSTRERFHAYAGQHNVGSWAKRSRSCQEYTLNHEQYHFNITELHARKLNEYIAENPDGSEYLYNLRRGSINLDLRRMQSQYDNETNHSLIYDRQRRWEYKIDSLLILSKGWTTDHFSGARAYFPTTPDSTQGFSENNVGYRCYYLKKYGMQFSLFSYHMGELAVYDLNNSAPSFEAKNGRVLKSVTVDSSVYDFNAFVISNDTSGFTYYTRWVYANPYLYKLYSWYPNDTGDSTGYAKNALSFVKSFQIENMDEYWIERLEASDSPIIFSTVSKKDEKKERAGSQYCMHIGSSKPVGFYRGPFFRDDGAMFLAVDHLVHPDSLHYQDVLLMNRDWYSHTPTPEGHVYFVPAKNIPNEKYDIKFGYILLKDSVNECYEFYHERLEVTPKIDEQANREF